MLTTNIQETKKSMSKNRYSFILIALEAHYTLVTLNHMENTTGMCRNIKDIEELDNRFFA